MKFQIEMAEKEADFLEQNDTEAASTHGLKDKSGLPPCSQMTGKETIDPWSAGLDAKPLNSDAADFVPAQNSPAVVIKCERDYPREAHS